MSEQTIHEQTTCEQITSCEQTTCEQTTREPATGKQTSCKTTTRKSKKPRRVAVETDPFPPIKRITRELNPRRTPGCPLLFFGLGFTIKQLVRYAKEHGLYDHSNEDVDWATVDALNNAAKHLAKLTDRMLYFSLTCTSRYDYVIGCYSNYSIWAEKMPEDEEDRVFDTIREEMGIGSKQKVRWHYHNDEWFAGLLHIVATGPRSEYSSPGPLVPRVTSSSESSSSLTPSSSFSSNPPVSSSTNS